MESDWTNKGKPSQRSCLFKDQQTVYNVATSGVDMEGLGRWAWTRSIQGKEGHHMRVVVCYQPVENKKRPQLVYNQHCNIIVQRKWQLPQRIIVYAASQTGDHRMAKQRGYIDHWGRLKWWHIPNFWKDLFLCKLSKKVTQGPESSCNWGSTQVDTIYVSCLLEHMHTVWAQLRTKYAEPITNLST